MKLINGKFLMLIWNNLEKKKKRKLKNKKKKIVKRNKLLNMSLKNQNPFILLVLKDV